MQIAVFWSEILHYHAARIAALYRAASGHGHVVHAFALRASAPDLPVPGYHDTLGSRVTILGTDPTTAGPFSKLSMRDANEFLSACSPDVVAIPGYSDPVTLGALAWCRRNSKGAVLMSESQAGDYRRSSLREWMKRHLVRTFDAALVGGTPHVAYIRSLGMPVERIFPGYDAVDNDFWIERASQVRRAPEAWRSALGLPDHFFSTASRLVPKKNVAGLLRAYASYATRSQTPIWPLVIMGDGPLKGRLETLAAELHVAKLVRFMGYLSAAEMATVYALASTFVLASGYYEQWGLVVNEAMASGIPVLVSQICGSAADLVVDGETGFKFDPRDENRLAQLLQFCTQGTLDLTQMGVAAQRRIAQFHPSVFAENLLLAADVADRNARSRRFDLASRAYIGGTRRLLRVTTAKIE